MTDRRLDLDWLRIAAFGLLILYHVGMFYVTWDWHVKSSRASDAIEPLMLAVNPWRLLLLFFISGAATRFMADKMSAGKLAASRALRLVPPVFLAVFVIVPPQSYYEVADAMRLGQLSADPAWLDNFYTKYVTASGHWCDTEGCLITPTYNHMWFVVYLFFYSMVMAALIPLLRRLPTLRLSGLGGAAVLFLGPWLFLWAARVVLFPEFEATHALIDDWYVHAVSFGAFALGFGVAKHQPFFDGCVRWRWLFLGVAVCAFALLFGFRAHYDGDPTPPSFVFWMRGVREAQAWFAITAAVGFAHAHLRGADGPIKRYLGEAIFPYYLVHQTAIVVAAYHLDRMALPLWLESSLVIFATLVACAATYEIAKRFSVLRPWFGLKKAARTRGADARQASNQTAG